MKRPVSESRAQDRNPSKGSADPKAGGGVGGEPKMLLFSFFLLPQRISSLYKKTKACKIKT